MNANADQELSLLGIRLGEDRLLVGERSFALQKGTRIEAEGREPSIRLYLAMLAAGALCIPLAIWASSGTATELSWLVALPVSTVLLASFQLLTASPRYLVVLEHGGRVVPAYVSDDPQLVVRVVAMLREAVSEPRR